MDLSSNQRYFFLDFIRGIAIVLMVVFHLCFDLNNFKFIDINIYNSSFWHYFRFLIVSLFLLCVGVSLHLANSNGINFTKLKKRTFVLLLASFAISISTYITFENSWIYFGILHFIALASVIGTVFVFVPTVSLFLGVFVIVGWNLDFLHMHWLFDYTKEFFNLPSHTEDSVPLTPWFGVVLIGIFFGSKNIHHFEIRKNKITKLVSYLGKNSLLVYLIHQPVLFGSIFLLHKYAI